MTMFYAYVIVVFSNEVMLYLTPLHTYVTEYCELKVIVCIYTYIAVGKVIKQASVF